MGLYDRVYVGREDTRFLCSDGHQLGATEFQSKDFGCTMGSVWIMGELVVIRSGDYGTPPRRPLLGRFEIYGVCRECPAFVQPYTRNLIDMFVDFEIAIVDDVIRLVERVGPTTAEWLASTPTQPYMHGCAGPMDWGAAWQLHVTGERVPWPRDDGEPDRGGS